MHSTFASSFQYSIAVLQITDDIQLATTLSRGIVEHSV